MSWPSFKIAVIAGNAAQYSQFISENFLSSDNFPLMTRKTQFNDTALHGCIKIGSWYEREDAKVLEKCAKYSIAKAVEISGMKNIFK